MKSDKELRRLATQCLRDLGLRAVTLDHLVSIIEARGFEIVDFSPTHNSHEVEVLISHLELRYYIKTQKAFTYSSGQTQIVFVCDTLGEEEKRIALSHELGHILCGHLENNLQSSRAVADEYEANEFAHYLLHPSASRRAITACLQHKLAFVLCVIAIVAICVSSVLLYRAHESQYHGQYFVAEDGERYHVESCFYIQGKPGVHRMTEEEYASGQYTPCKVCIPIANSNN